MNRVGRRLAVSDIHGEGHRLLQVLEKAHYEPGNDRLFLLGDYIDRGIDSRLTIQIVQNLVKDGAIALLGNHDEWAIQAATHPTIIPHWMTQGGDKTMEAFGGLPSRQVIKWLLSLPLYHEEPDCILAHAGLRPGISLQDQDPNDLLWIRREFHEGYRGKRVIFGHTPTQVLYGEEGKWEIWHGPDKTGIDTGAAYGGRLTLYDIDTHRTWWA